MTEPHLALIANIEELFDQYGRADVWKVLDRFRASPDYRRLQGNTDPAIWAEEFNRVHPEISQSYMQTWFKNALEVGTNEGKKSELETGTALDMAIIDAIGWAEVHCENPKLVNNRPAPCGKCSACSVGKLLAQLRRKINEG